MKLVMGIDTSTTCTGYGVLSVGRKIKLVTYGKIYPPEELDYLEKCRHIVDALEKVISKYSEELVGIAAEQPNSFRGGSTTRMLCGLYGIVRYMIWLRFKLNPMEMNTLTAKKAISGRGDATKQQVVDAVNKQFNKKFIYTTSKSKANKYRSDDDITDAIGVAMAYINEIRK